MCIFDSSALVKRYIAEPASAQVEALVAEADIAATSLITRAEVAAALAWAVRMNWLTHDVGRARAEGISAALVSTVSLEYP